MSITLCGHLPQPPPPMPAAPSLNCCPPRWSGIPIAPAHFFSTLNTVSSVGVQLRESVLPKTSCQKYKNVVFNFDGIYKANSSFHLLKLKNMVQFAKKNWKIFTYSKNTYLNYIMELSELVRTSDFCMILWLWHQNFTQWYLTCIKKQQCNFA